MASTNNCQPLFSYSPKIINCQNRWNNVPSSSPNEVVDKRLWYSSKIDQPTHLKFGRQHKLDLFRVKNARHKDESRAGYSPFRGDFETEYNNNAENSVVLASKLSTCYCEDKFMDGSEREEIKLIKNLQISLAEQYTSQLRERERRKNILKRHGLMNLKGTALWFSRLEIILGKYQAKKFVRLSPLISADEMEYLASSLESVNNKRAEVNKLTFYRTQRGITSKWDMDIFESERRKRELALSVERVDIRKLDAHPFLTTTPTLRRRRRHLEIFHLPRYKDLSPKEVDLCSANGLEPSFFLDAKDFLISDCKKNNGILLKKARKLVRIDVNKTRKIFDLLMEEGRIWTPTPDQGNTKSKLRKRGRSNKKREKTNSQIEETPSLNHKREETN